MVTRFVVNALLDVVLGDDGMTRVHVAGKEFMQCMRLMLTIPLDEDTSDVESIDDAATRYGTVHDGRGMEPPVYHVHLDPEEEFLGHCSNIQAWAEHDYDLRILHSNISFPLLKELASAGDEKARRVFPAVIRERMWGATSETAMLLLEHASTFLSKDEQAYLVETVQVSPGSVEAWSRLGDVLRDIKNYETAAVVYRKVLHVDPENVDAWIELGVALNKKGDVDGAIGACRKSVAIDPKRAIAWNNLAYYLDESGQHQEAMDVARQGLSIDPKHKISWNTLGDVYLRATVLDLDEASKCFQRVLDLARDGPRDDDGEWYHVPYAWLGLARVLASRGQHREARDALDTGLRMAPDLVTVSLGFGAPAMDALDTALRMAPGLAGHDNACSE